jgi:hypothetical protein
MKKMLILIVFLLCLYSESWAAITFGNTGRAGLWVQDFDGMGDWVDSPSQPPWTGTIYGMDFGSNRGQAANGQYSAIGAAFGISGKGFRQWTSTNHNGHSVGIRPSFPSSLSEFWLRASFRWQPMSGLNASGNYKKVFYMMPSSGNCVDGHDAQTNGSFLEYFVGGTYSFSNSAGGAGGYTTTFADSQWHTIEIHVGGARRQMWVDGVNVIDDAVGPPTCSWSGVRILDNNSINDGNAWPIYIDVDDVAIAINSYSGFVVDSGGRRMIGPAGSGPPVPPGTPSPPRSFGVTGP